MRVIFDVVHPADVLFFKRPIEALLKRGDEVRILSRYKDIACELLDDFGFRHIPISRAGAGAAGLAIELIRRDAMVLKHALTFKPDVMVGFGGVSISHAGKLAGVKTISFYDSDNAKLQNWISRPFLSELYVPEAYSGPVSSGRTTRLKGVKELSYLHPNWFNPDRVKAIAAGLDPDRENFFIRLVSWRANHDLGKTGWSEQLLRETIATLSAKGRVHLSSEVPLPADLAEHAYYGAKTDAHHVLAFCRLLVGESATMASEAAILGAPGIYAGRDVPGYVDELEANGLVQIVRRLDRFSLREAIEKALATPLSEIVDRRDKYVSDCPDWAEAVVNAIDGEPVS